MRNHLFSAIGVLSLALVLTACEGSPYPISEPGDAAVRNEVLGEWMAVDDDGTEARIAIWQFNKFEYLVRYSASDQDEDAFLRAYESRVASQTWTNLVCVACDEDEPEFIFVRMDVLEGALNLTWIDSDLYEELEEATGSPYVAAAFRNWIAEGKPLADETWVWTRVPEDD